jgi:hypothetical protein
MRITRSRRLVPQAESGLRAGQYDGPPIGRSAKSLPLYRRVWSPADRPDSPQSLHYMLVKAHRQGLRSKLARQLPDPRQLSSSEMSRASEEVEKINFCCSNLLETFTDDFLDRARGLELLEEPRVSRHI